LFLKKLYQAEKHKRMFTFSATVELVEAFRPVQVVETEDVTATPYVPPYSGKTLFYVFFSHGYLHYITQ
jgi:hypothetical protein